MREDKVNDEQIIKEKYERSRRTEQKERMKRINEEKQYRDRI